MHRMARDAAPLAREAPNTHFAARSVLGYDGRLSQRSPHGCSMTFPKIAQLKTVGGCGRAGRVGSGLARR